MAEQQGPSFVSDQEMFDLLVFTIYFSSFFIILHRKEYEEFTPEELTELVFLFLLYVILFYILIQNDEKKQRRFQSDDLELLEKRKKHQEIQNRLEVEKKRCEKWKQELEEQRKLLEDQVCSSIELVTKLYLT